MRRALRRIVLAAAVSFASLCAAPAWAGDEATAEALFQEGLAAMKKNDLAVACEAFTKSNKLDPSPGTQINLAVCFEKQKKWASAWTWYRNAAGLAHQRNQPDREKLAQDAAAKIKPKLHHIVVAIHEPLDALVVKRDGLEIETTLAGQAVPLPVDPGDHMIEVSARGKKPWSKSLAIADTPTTDRIEVPKLEDAPAPASPVATVAPGPTPATTEPPPVVVESNEGSSRRTIGLVVGLTGVAAGLVAGGFGVFTVVANNKADDDKARYEKSNSSLDYDQEKTHRDAARTDQLVAIVVGASAGVAIATGAILYFTAPKPTRASGFTILPSVGPHEASLGVGGAF